MTLILPGNINRTISFNEIESIEKNPSSVDNGNFLQVLQDFLELFKDAICGTKKAEVEKQLKNLFHTEGNFAAKEALLEQLKSNISPDQQNQISLSRITDSECHLVIRVPGQEERTFKLHVIPDSSHNNNTNISAPATAASSTNAVTNVKPDAVDEKKWQGIARYFPANKQQQAKEQLSKLANHQHQKGPWLETFDALKKMATSEYQNKFVENIKNAEFTIYDDMGETYLDDYVIKIAPWNIENCSPEEKYIPADFAKNWQSIKCYFPEDKQEEAKKIACYLAIFNGNGASREIYEKGFNQLRDMAQDDYKKCFVIEHHIPTHNNPSPESTHFQIQNTFDDNFVIIDKHYWH